MEHFVVAIALRAEEAGRKKKMGAAVVGRAAAKWTTG